MAETKVKPKQILDSLDGLVIGDGSGFLEAIKVNRSATAPPAGGNDSSQGYTILSFWLDTTNDRAYVCLDASVGNAIWLEITPGNTADARARKMAWLL